MSRRCVTRAVREGDDYVVNGQKIWTSFGAVSDFVYLICRTVPTARSRRYQRTDRADDVRHRGASDQGHGRGAHFCEVFFTDVRVPREQSVGSRRGFQTDDASARTQRGGIDRLVSNHALYRRALERAT